MAFREYWQEHPEWNNPFSRIKAPRKKNGKRRNVLGEDEIVRLFYPGVITDPLERAVAMFWAGLRRSEIWGLKAEDLDWRPQSSISVMHGNGSPPSGVFDKI
jgi:integrase